MKTRHPASERGQSLVLFALLLPILAGFAGIVVDGGHAFGEKRRVQNAADAAALAAASELNDDGTACGGSDATPGTCRYRVRTVAEQYSGENGGVSSLHACSGDADTNCYLTPYKGSNSLVQVRLRNETAGLFSNVFGISVFRPAARAAAGPELVTTTVTTSAGTVYDRIYHDNSPAITANTTCGFPGLDLNNEVIDAPFTARGNVCLRGTSTLLAGGVNGRVDIGGGLHTWGSSSKAGVSSGNRIAAAQAALGCRTGTTTSLSSNPWVPCADSTHRVWANNVGQSPVNLFRDEFDWQAEYDKAAPGPTRPCDPALGSTGTAPVFDNNGTYSGAAGTAIDFTPSTSYVCRATAPDGSVGELSWNATTKVLTVSGVIFFDRRWSPGLFNAGVVHYYGKATIFFSSPQQVTWSGEKYCAGGTPGVDCAASSGASMPSWTPADNTLWLVLGGKNGTPFDTGAASPSPSTNSDLDFTAPSAFQGGIYTLNRCHVHGAGAYLAGPLVCGQIDTAGLGDSALQFPPVTLYEGGGTSTTTTTTTGTGVILLSE